MPASRILVATYVILFLGATGRSIVQIVRDFETAPLAYSLSAAAATVYLLAGIAIALASRGDLWRRIAWIALGFEGIGVITVGTMSYLVPDLFPADTVWSLFGRGYIYIPLVLPLIGVSYLETLRRIRLSEKNELDAHHH